MFPLDGMVFVPLSIRYVPLEIVSSRHKIIPDRLASSENRRHIRYTCRDAMMAIRYSGNVV